MYEITDQDRGYDGRETIEMSEVETEGLREWMREMGNASHQQEEEATSSCCFSQILLKENDAMATQRQDIKR